MQINIYKDPMQKAYLFGAAVLYSAQPIPREDVPQGWYCYDLRGTTQDPDRPYSLVDQAEKNHAGSILSCLPLKSGRSQSRLLKDAFHLVAVSVSLSEFCADEKIRCPETPLRHAMRPASPEEAGFFYAMGPEQDKELGAIGHVRIDFGHGGKGFYHTWWPRGPEELNTPEFKNELGKVIDDLRKSVLKDLPSMRRCCYGSEGAIQGGTCCQNYGFTLETEHYLYRLRCNPIEGDYQAYLSCFDKQAQKMEATPVIGRISFASGEQEDFTDPQEYLKAVREELPYLATTGFRCETLTNDPAVRKVVDDAIFDLYGEENTRQIEDYNNTGMTMGGM